MPTPEINATVSEATKIPQRPTLYGVAWPEPSGWRVGSSWSTEPISESDARMNTIGAVAITIPGEAQATREGEKELKWGCKLLPSKTGISGKGVYSPSGKFYLYGLSPSHSWAECEKDETYTHFPDDAAALAALNSCNTPPPDWKEPESIFDKFDKIIASMSPETLASLPVSQPPQGKTETVKEDTRRCAIRSLEHLREMLTIEGDKKAAGMVTLCIEAILANPLPAQSPAQQGAEKMWHDWEDLGSCATCRRCGASMGQGYGPAGDCPGPATPKQSPPPRPTVDQSEMMRVVEGLRDRLNVIVERHNRHIHQSPGAGSACQKYGLACIADVAHDFRAELSTLIKSLNTETHV